MSESGPVAEFVGAYLTPVNNYLHFYTHGWRLGAGLVGVLRDVVTGLGFLLVSIRVRMESMV